MSQKHSVSEEPARKPYETPQLRVHGAVEHITKIGVGAKSETHPTQPGSQP